MGIKLNKTLVLSVIFSRACSLFFVTLFNFFRKFKRLTAIVSALDNMKFSCHWRDYLRNILKGHLWPKCHGLISTSSLKYTYLHMNLWTGAKIRQGLPKRELVKKAPTNLPITSRRVSREQETQTNWLVDVSG